MGRDREIGDIRRALSATRTGAGHVVVLVGEAGIGKSRLAAEFAQEARAGGCRILVGRCHEDLGAPAHWPWIQIIRSYAEGRDAHGLLADLGPCAADIAQIVPSLRDSLGDLPAPARLQPEQARFRAFDSVALFFHRLAAERPVVLLVEDVQWADRASLMLLAFLVRELADSPVLLVATQREEDVDRTHPLATTIGELARHPRAMRIELRGLSRADVEHYVTATGLLASPRLVEAVHRASDGNPLYVTEIVRLLIADRGDVPGGDEEPAALGIPGTVRAVIRQRLDRLSADCRQMLGSAAAIGRELDLGVLARVSDLLRPTLMKRLDEALGAKVLAEVPALPGRFRFSHALVRDTLYEDLSAGRRLALHARIGEALEEQFASSLEPRLAELAHHFFLAAPAGSSTKAIDYALRAATHSAASLAHEDAALQYERAGRLTEQAGGDERRSCELELLASESHLRAGDSARAAIGFRTVLATAGRIGDAELLARAALGAAGPVVAFGVADPAIVRTLEQALEMLPEGDGALRARVLARLASETLYSDDRERSLLLTGEAVTMAQRVGDLPTLALALAAKRDQQWRSGDIETRLGEASDLLRAASEGRNDEIGLRARHWRILDLLELGEISVLEGDLQSFERLARELRDPLSLYRAAALRGTLAILQGRFADAERFGSEFLARGRSVSPTNSAHAYYGQKALVHLLRGETEEALAIGKPAADSFPDLTYWRACVAGVLAGVGRRDEARRELELIDPAGRGTIPESLFRAPTLAFLGYASARLGDRERTARIYPLFLPYAGRNLVFGLGAATWGATDFFLALMASTMGQGEVAARHFEAAIELGSRMQARPFVAHARCDFAAMLLARRDPADAKRARTLLQKAQLAAAELGMRALEARAAQLLEESAVGSQPERAGGAAATSPSETRAAGAGELLFRNEGEFWSIGDPARAFRLKDSVGLRCLAHLLRQPGHELLALDVACAVRGGDHAELLGASSTGARLDPKALQAYRERLRELREELEAARSLGDARHTERTEMEMEQISAELSRAIGLGGRARPQSVSPSERARQNVTRAIRAAIRRIAVNDRRLGRYLSNSVRTGTFCSYDPTGDASVAWLF